MTMTMIMIEVSGGVVTQVTADRPVKVVLWDHDNDGAPEGEPCVGPEFMPVNVSVDTIKRLQMLEEEIRTHYQRHRRPE